MPESAEPMRLVEVPDELIALACKARAAGNRLGKVDPVLLYGAEVRDELGAVLPAAHRRWFAELFGTPEEIAARLAEPARPDDVTALCERAQPGEHERQTRAKVVSELEALRDGVQNPDKPYNEAFIHALDCAIREIARGGA